jgi:hypothetical protein
MSVPLRNTMLLLCFRTLRSDSLFLTTYTLVTEKRMLAHAKSCLTRVLPEAILQIQRSQDLWDRGSDR